MIEKLKFDRLYYNKDIIIQSLLNKVDELVEKVNYLEQNNGQGSGISNNPLLGNRTLTPDTLCECGCPNNKFAHEYCATNCERFKEEQKGGGGCGKEIKTDLGSAEVTEWCGRGNFLCGECKCKCGLFDWANLCESCQSRETNTPLEVKGLGDDIPPSSKPSLKMSRPDICICKYECSLPFCFPRNHGKCCECSKVKDG